MSTSYTLFNSLSNDTNTGLVIAGSLAGITNYSDVGLTTNTMYFYWVKAYNISGGSAFSAVMSNRTWPLAPVSPVIHSAIAIGTNQIDVEWSVVPTFRTHFSIVYQMIRILELWLLDLFQNNQLFRYNSDF